MTSPNPPMYYDYYNFPKETYEIQWPAPGAPEVAHRVQELLEEYALYGGSKLSLNVIFDPPAVAKHCLEPETVSHSSLPSPSSSVCSGCPGRPTRRKIDCSASAVV